MAFGYLIPLLLVGVCCLAALIRPRRVSRKRYAVTVAINEIPHVATLLLIVATALAWSEGDLAGADGLVLALIAGLVLLLCCAVLAAGSATWSRCHP